MKGRYFGGGIWTGLLDGSFVPSYRTGVPDLYADRSGRTGTTALVDSWTRLEILANACERAVLERLHFLDDIWLMQIASTVPGPRSRGTTLACSGRRDPGAWRVGRAGRCVNQMLCEAAHLTDDAPYYLNHFGQGLGRDECFSQELMASEAKAMSRV